MVGELEGNIANRIENIQEEGVPNDVPTIGMYRYHGHWEKGWDVQIKHQTIVPQKNILAE